MLVMFDHNCEWVICGNTVQELIDNHRREFDMEVPYDKVTIVQGAEKKFDVQLVDVNSSKPVAKPTAAKKPAVKKTVSK